MTKRKPLPQKKPQGEHVLGFFVTHYTVDAVLLKTSAEKPEIIRRFVRQRIRQPEMPREMAYAQPTSAKSTATPDDFTLHVGDGGAENGTEELFLTSEFSSIEKTDSTAATPPPAAQRPEPFEFQLKEILDECEELGYGTPGIAFCVGEPHVTFVEISAPETKKGGKTSKNGTTAAPAQAQLSRSKLLQLLSQQHHGKIEKDRVAFIPLTPRESRLRYLAVVPERSEPVTATLQALQDKRQAKRPPVRLIDTEVSLYTSLARNATFLTDDKTTAVVRVGLEDTLIIFMKGSTLHYYERIRALTSVDSPSTICSRILLHQDDKKVSDLHNVLVLSDRQDEELAHEFRRMFPSAEVDSLLNRLMDRGVTATTAASGALNSSALPALGVALRLSDGWGEKGSFTDVNLLPSKLRRKKRVLEIAWHSIAAIVLLFVLSGYFSYEYMVQRKAIAQAEQELQVVAPSFSMSDVTAQRAHIDDLQAAYDRYSQSLGILDSLLLGSDRWSRIMEKTSSATSRVPGIWIVSMRPTGNEIRIEGNALARYRVAQLARLLNGSIDVLAFSEINDVTVYHYSMSAPNPVSMPPVALRLRELAMTEVAEEVQIDDLEDHRHLEEIIVREARR